MASTELPGTATGLLIKVLHSEGPHRKNLRNSGPSERRAMQALTNVYDTNGTPSSVTSLLEAYLATSNVELKELIYRVLKLLR